MTDPLLSLHLAGNARSVLRPVLIATMLGLALVLVSARLFTTVTTVELMAPSALLVATAASLYLLTRGRVAVAPYLMIGALLGTAVVGCLEYGSIRSVTSLSFVSAVVVASVFLERRAVIGSILFTSALIGALVAGEATGQIAALRRPVGWINWLVFSVALVLVGLVVHYAHAVAVEAHERLQRELEERISADANRRRADERLRLAMEASRQGWFDLDIPSGTVVASDQYARLIGSDPTRQDLTLATWTASIHPDDRSAVLTAFQECLSTGATRQMDYRLRTRTNPPNWLWIRSIAQVVEWDEQHRPRRMTGTHADMSEQMRASEALRESEAKFRAVVDVTPSGLIIHDDERVTYANAAAARILGAESPGRLLGSLLKDIVHPESWAMVQGSARMASASGQVAPPAETVFVRLDGTPVETEAVGTVMTISGKTLVVLLFHDITERKRVDATLRESEKRYRTLFEQSGDSILLLEIMANGPPIVRDANRQALHTHGFSREEIIGEPVTIVEPDFSAEALQYRQQHIRAAGSMIFETKHHRKDGSAFDAEVRVTEFMMQGKRMAISTERDISERKESEAHRASLEAQLRQAQKLESVGRLAGGVAHDFNNMLGVIIGFADLSAQRLDPGHPVLDDLSEISAAARRSAELTRQLLTFARKQTVAPAVLDLNRELTRSSRMLERLIGEHIRLEWRPGDGLWPVFADASQVDQIIANLCVNAKDAIADVGTLCIATENCVIGDEFAVVHADAESGKYVRLSVSDTGHGMTNEVVAHIFEPFFTTKGVGEGTGLGLATVYGAVRQNHGFITVSSRVGHGSVFEIYFPQYVGARDVASVGDLNVVPARGHETILVVEDEVSLLRLTTKALEHSGYVVLTASNPATALTLATAHAGDIHLLLTDVVMPGMNGGSLATAIRTHRPNIQWLYMSGYAADVAGGAGIFEDATRFIGKPFTTSALTAKVREVLDRA